MSWGTITGDERIIPGGSDGNEVILENGKPVKCRLILQQGEEPYSFFEHAIEVDVVGENGQHSTIFRTVRCPKTQANPNAPCPLCDGQQIRRRVRNACNVWNYDMGKVQKLCQGDGVWKPIATTRKLGIDVLGVDWALLRTGTGRNDTTYSATNLGPTQFMLPQGTPLYDIRSEYAPHTIEEMKSVVESCGLNWASVIVPPSVSYGDFNSLEAALSHVMPNGKHKGKTMKQLWEEDPSPRGMINFLATKSDRVTLEKSAARIILVNLGGANIEGVPKFTSGGAVTYNTGSTSTATPASTPAPAATPATPASTPAPAATPATPASTPAPAAPAIVPASTPTAPTVSVSAPVVASAPVSGDRQSKITAINNAFSTNKKFIDGGFNMIMDLMKKVGGGKTNVSDFSDAELDTLLDACK